MIVGDQKPARKGSQWYTATVSGAISSVRFRLVSSSKPSHTATRQLLSQIRSVPSIICYTCVCL